MLSNNQSALQAAVAIFFVFKTFYGGTLDGIMFIYIGEFFLTHIRAKDKHNARSNQALRTILCQILGACLGVAMMSSMNIIWLQSVPTAFISISRKFHLTFIISESIGAMVICFSFPGTSYRPLKDIAVVFEDENEAIMYQKDLWSIR